MCLLYVSLGSRVSPSILGLMFMGSMVLFICMACYLSGLRMRVFVCIHVCISCRYD